MHLGIFAKTFPRRTFAETLEAVAAHGFQSIQFNFSCIGLPTLPPEIEPDLLSRLRCDCAGGLSTSPIPNGESAPRETRPSIGIAGVSGTFNMIDPDIQKRRQHLGRLGILARATREIGCDLITLCTGTRDPEDMWRAHPENNSPQAWRDLLQSMEQAIETAETHDVLLGVEPEIGNVVSSTRKARQLLDELHSPRLKIVLDPANLFRPAHTGKMRETIEEGFQLLGTDIVMAHAKELAADGHTGNVAPGHGVLDWNYYFDTLARVNFSGPIVMHGLSEPDVPQAARFLRAKLCD